MNADERRADRSPEIAFSLDERSMRGKGTGRHHVIFFFDLR
jgi:hypothetical protein